MIASFGRGNPPSKTYFCNKIGRDTSHRSKQNIQKDRLSRGGLPEIP